MTENKKLIRKHKSIPQKTLSDKPITEEQIEKMADNMRKNSKEHSEINPHLKEEIDSYDWRVLNRVKDVLQEKNLDQTWLAEQIGMDRSTISSLINNRTQTTMSNAFKIAYALGVPIQELFYVDSQRIISDFSNTNEEDITEFNTNTNTDSNTNYINAVNIKIVGKKLDFKEVLNLFEDKGNVQSLEVKYSDSNNSDNVDIINKLNNMFIEMASVKNIKQNVDNTKQ